MTKRYSDGNSSKMRTALLARADSIHLLYRQSAPAVILTFLSTILISAILWEDANPRRLLVWMILVCVMILWRGGIFFLYFRNKPHGLDRLKWERPFVSALFASAFVWSVGLTIVAYQMSLESRLFAYFFLMGMAAGAISVFIALRYAAIVTVSIMLLPMTFVFLRSGHASEMITAIAACTAIISTISGTKILGNNLLKIFTLTHDLADKTQKVEKARLAAEYAKNTRGQFVASVSHEIRTPLNVILGMIEMIRSEPLTDAGARYVSTLEIAGSHLKALVDNVLDFVKIDENQMELHEDRSDIVDIAQKIIEVFEDTAKKKGIVLLLDCQGLQGTKWFVDQQRFKQIIFNVVGNALNYSQQGIVTLKLRNSPQSSGISILVADQGSGIHKDKLEQIFEPYIQDKERQLDEIQGTGLGLAITKKLVDLMQGKIQVKSRLGVGSVFRITLPLVPAHEVTESTQGKIPEEFLYPELKGKTLLVAEDMPLNRDLINDFLRDTGLSVTFVTSGVEALNVMQKTSFDLIFLDLQMAQKGGIETTQEIRRREAQLNACRCPIIIQSADNRIESVDASLAAGADYFLPKPFSRNQLLKTLSQLLQRGEECSADTKPQSGSVISRLMPRFISETTTALGVVELALNEEDFITAAKELHKIKGFCGMFQKTELYQHADDWEKSCVRENLREAKEQQSLFLTIFREVKSSQ